MVRIPPSCVGSSAGRHVLELSATWPIKEDSDRRPARRYVCMAESCLAVRPRAKLACPLFPEVRSGVETRDMAAEKALESTEAANDSMTDAAGFAS